MRGSIAGGDDVLWLGDAGFAAAGSAGAAPSVLAGRSAAQQDAAIPDGGGGRAHGSLGGREDGVRGDSCHVAERTEYWGDALKWGPNNKQDSWEDCCESCSRFDGGGGPECNVWVYCGTIGWMRPFFLSASTRRACRSRARAFFGILDASDDGR